MLGGPIRLCGWSFTSAIVVSAESTPANPGAGTADATVFTAPTGQTTTLAALFFHFLTDATVGNRVVRIEIRDGAGNVVSRITALTAVPASTGSDVSAFIGSTFAGAASGQSSVPLPSAPMLGGWTVHITVTGTVGAADQISAIAVLTTGSQSGGIASIRDGGQLAGTIAIGAGGADTHDTGGEGILIGTELSVLATQGAMSGVLWYYIESDVDGNAVDYGG